MLALGLGVKLFGEMYRPASDAFFAAAIALVGVAVAGGLVAVLNIDIPLTRRINSDRVTGWVAVVVAATFAGAIFLGRVLPASADAGSPGPFFALMAACAAAAVGVCVAAALPASRRTSAFASVATPVALILHLLANFAAIRAAPAPMMDVLVFQELAAQEVTAGRNPYAMTFPDLSAGTSPHYGPGLQADGQLLFGFPYTPWSLWCVLPAWLLAVEVQHAHAVAFTAAAALVAYASRTRAAKAAGALLLLMPVGPLVVCYGWTEPLVALPLALTVFSACRRRDRAAREVAPGRVEAKSSQGGRAQVDAVGLGLGLLWAAKQYVPLTGPLALLFLDRPGTRKASVHFFATAVVTAAVISLPLILWNVPAFWHSAVAVQFLQPFRDDALSFLAASSRWTGVRPPAWIAFVALASVQALALWRSPRTPAGFAVATAVSLLAFFAFGKQAFANYYFLVYAALACGLAAMAVPEPKLQAAERDRGFAPVMKGRSR